MSSLTLRVGVDDQLDLRTNSRRSALEARYVNACAVHPVAEAAVNLAVDRVTDRVYRTIAQSHIECHRMGAAKAECVGEAARVGQGSSPDGRRAANVVVEAHI